MAQHGPQHIAPIVAWLATEEAAGITGEIFHTGYGGVAIMQQPAIIQQFKKSSGTWSLDELDSTVPKLLKTRQANVEAAKIGGAPIEV
jgi:3-oxoacyl-[acyl-carrier protein] reductase